jgi:hypothetical protein
MDRKPPAPTGEALEMHMPIPASSIGWQAAP